MVACTCHPLLGDLVHLHLLKSALAAFAHHHLAILGGLGGQIRLGAGVEAGGDEAIQRRRIVEDDRGLKLLIPMPTPNPAEAIFM